MKKIIGFIGLGKMGKNMVLNLLSKNYEVVVYDRLGDKVEELGRKGAIKAYSLKELAEKLPSEKIIIMMVTAGKPVDEIILGLSLYISKRDIIIDGGNSFYKDSIKRCGQLKKRGIYFVDMGVSGGPENVLNGTSLTVGGEKEAFEKIKFILKDLSVKDGCVYVGKAGAGHFVKMIHNGIEYALLDSYSEGFELLKKSKYKLDLREIATAWNNNSIIKSDILKLIVKALEKNPELKGVHGVIGGGETGTWCLKEAGKMKSDFGTLRQSLYKRKLSKRRQSFSSKLISLLRNEFGGHEIK